MTAPYIPSAAFGLAFGILAEGAWVSAPQMIWWVATVLAGIALVGAMVCPCSQTLRLVVVFCLAATLGGLRLAQRCDQESRPCWIGHAVKRDRALRVGGVIVRTLSPKRGKQQATIATRAPYCGSIRVTLSAQPRHQRFHHQPLRAGDVVELHAKLRDPIGRRNPGRERVALALKQHRIGARATITHRQLVMRSRAPDATLAAARRCVRRTIVDANLQHAEQAILLALALGDKRGLGDTTRRAFAAAGISHLLAISGLHLGLATAMLYGLLCFLLRRQTYLAESYNIRRAAAAVAMIGAIAFTAFTGAAIPTVRACTMACAWLIAIVVGRSNDFSRPFGAAALLLLLIDPYRLFAPGFQLSFAAVLGIVCALKRRPNWSMVRASIAATLVTAPLVAHHFGSVSIIGVVVNLFAIPWTSFILLPITLSGVVVALVGDLFGLAALATPLIKLAGLTVTPLSIVSYQAAKLPFAAIDLGPAWPMTLSALSLSFALLIGHHQHRRKLLAATFFFALFGGGPYLAQAIHPKQLRVIFFDVGQGDAALIQLPTDETILIDGGPPTRSRSARLSNALKSMGIGKVDIIVATHDQADHVGGLGDVARRLGPSVVWHDGLSRRRFAGQWKRAPEVTKIGAVTVKRLWPTTFVPINRNKNNNSLVLLIRYGRARLLFTGDIERPVEEALLHQLPKNITLLKVPHHGSNSSSTTAFVRRLRPKLAVISCGRQNRFGFPAKPVLRRYANVGSQVLRTDEDGAIEVTVTEDAETKWRTIWSPLP